MTQAPPPVKEQYYTDFHALEQRLADSEPSWLHDLRKRAFSRFVELGFPTARRGNEPWKYTNVAPVANATFPSVLDAVSPTLSLKGVQRVAPWRKEWINIVFVDGRYAEALSTPSYEVQGAYVTDLVSALAARGETVERHLSKYARFEEEAFTALNTAFLQDGAYIEIADEAEFEVPVNLLYVTTGAQGESASYPRSLVVTGAHSKVTLIESYVALTEGAYLTDAVTEIVVGEGAKVDHYKLLRESPSAYHVGVNRLELKRDSQASSTFIGQGVAIGRNDIHANQAESGSTVHLWGLYITRGKEHVDNYINIDHVAPHTMSRIYYKGILDGESHAVYGGTVFVHKGAMKTDARQDDKNLLLSVGAEVDTKPALEIYADDVKCGHGAASGRIDENTLFYMRTRGLDLETASQLLIYGFVSEIIEAVKLVSFREHLNDWVNGITPTLSHVRFGEDV